MKKIALFSLISLFVLSACHGAATDSSAADAAQSQDSTPTFPGDPTYHQDIAPIYAKRCVNCHATGGIAPFPLDTYASAKSAGLASQAATTNRTMPPYAVSADGSCGTFRDARWLSDAELGAIAKWVDGGMPEGVATGAAPQPPKLNVLDGNVVEYAMPQAYAPVPSVAGGHDDYRCFPMDMKLKKDQFVTGFEVVPGDPRIVHHVLTFSVSPDAFPIEAPSYGANSKVIDALQAANTDRLGWPCYAGAGKGVLIDALPATWAPGQGATKYPAGTGLRVKAGEILVMQVHYNLANVAQNAKPSDLSKVRLQLADSIDREGFMVLHDPFLFTSFTNKPQTLAANKKGATIDWTATRKDLDFFLPNSAGDNFEIFAIYPHMHKFGRKAQLTLTHPNAPEVCGAIVEKWNFDWQGFYWYDKPLQYDANTLLHYTCVYDTTGATSPITPGFGTENEMCLAGLYFVKK